MKITRLELQNYKCFNHLILDNLGDRVVLVGPNGCGKSTILESIASLKEYISSYNLQPHVRLYQGVTSSGRRGTVWQNLNALPLMPGRDYATVTVDISLNEAESLVVDGNNNIRARIRIDQDGLVTPTLSHENISNLFQHFDPNSGIGVFDYISPQRQYFSTQVTSLDIGSLSLQRQKEERIQLPNTGNPSIKFAAIKHFIISEQLKDLSLLNSTGVLNNSIDLLQNLFSFFFDPKLLIGAVNNGQELQVGIRTPHGDHDMDQLSSGEKELFTIFTNLFRIRNFPAIILYDEPERHVNPGLESRIIPALDRLQTQNQLWIATHGTELISSVPMKEIVALSKSPHNSTAKRFLDDSKTERIRLFEEIGARVGLQLSSNRVVFLEGKQAHADKRIIDRLIGPLLPSVQFIASGSALDVQGTATRASLLIESASKDTAFLMVLDRDYRDENSAKDLAKRLNNRVFIWPCHEVENLLLEPTILLDILRLNGEESRFNKESQVMDALTACVQNISERLAVDWATYRLHSAMSTSSAGSPRDDVSYLEMVKSRREKLAGAYAEERAATLLSDAKNSVTDCLADGSWTDLLPGKEILDEFRKTYLRSLPGELFKEQIVARMVEREFVPPHIKSLRDFINKV